MKADAREHVDIKGRSKMNRKELRKAIGSAAPAKTKAP
jgi:hypothetical protein